ncbi:MAG: GNAT family N-acetyltransferase [Candidatus Nanopelagicales bacterium]
MSISRPAGSAVPAARMAVRIGPADVGRRVSVRTVATGSAAATEAVGELMAWDGGTHGTLLVRRRDGAVESLQAAALVSGFVVAPGWGAYDLQAVAQQAWRPETAVPLGDWVLRWSGGVSGRADSSRVGADPRTDVAGALAATTAFYAERGGRPLLQTPEPSAYDADFEAAGWAVVRGVSVLVARAEARSGGGGSAEPGALDVVVTVEPHPDADWIDAMDEAERVRPAVVGILRRTAPAAYLIARGPDGAVVGIARAALAAGPGRRSRERWAVVTNVHTAPGARRRGVATALMRTSAEWAHGQAAVGIALQVLDGNDAALRLYAALGFDRHHHYVYRSPVPGDVP